MKIRLTEYRLSKLPPSTQFSVVYALYRCHGLWERYTVNYDIGIDEARRDIETTPKPGLRWYGVTK